MSAEEKVQYLAEFERLEKIVLNPERIEKNEVLRTLSKLCLNSLWGKFAQRENQPKTAILSEPRELLQLLNAPNVSITSLLADIGEKILINYQDEAAVSRNTNVVIAAFTTAHARCQLYKLLHMAGENTLYFDTDSIIYVEKDDQPIFKVGSGLGELKDEIFDEYGAGAKIVEYASGGAKNYSYVVEKADGTKKQVRRIKGITLKANNQEETSIETLKMLIDNEDESVRVNFLRRIQRTSEYQIYSATETSKLLRLVYDKRCRAVGSYLTRPWGEIEGAQELAPNPNIEIEGWQVRDYNP
ncbi:uncharacterized protein LOC132196213 isoform X2 [Neocloeon triangulifer]|nr:uncharacterized protein LOC132196213 isoform X2 [Neocloeon triangulifer]